MFSVQDLDVADVFKSSRPCFKRMMLILRPFAALGAVFEARRFFPLFILVSLFSLDVFRMRRSRPLAGLHGVWRLQVVYSS